MTNRHIKRVAVLGSGVMGSRIACHFANAGINVLLLDIAPRELSEAEQAKGLTLEMRSVRNRIVNEALQTAVASNPSPLYRKSFASRIETGNFDDDLSRVAECDWILEAIIERLDIKNDLFGKVEKVRKPGTLISTNTSGIPIHLMIEGRSDDFKKHFAGTHFFNPPRYLPLLEIIPTKETAPEVTEFYMDFGRKILGKKTVHCKDTPAFIANRVGVYGILSIFDAVEKLDLNVEQIDKLTGPVLGRPKSATFRTSDVVGLDTLALVANGLKENAKDDEQNALFTLPGFVQKMLDNKWLGDKTKQGFYKKTVSPEGKKEILALDLKTLEYRPQEKVSFPTLEMTKPVENLKERVKMLFAGQDKAGEFYRHMFGGLFAYVTNRIPGIADHLYQIDDAIKAGFGWELGPFETWDVIGLEQGLKLAQSEGRGLPKWITEMQGAGFDSFYKFENGRKLFYNQQSKSYEPIPGTDDILDLSALRETSRIWNNSDATITDLGDGILNLEFHTKMNTIGAGVIQGINKAIDLAEQEHKGLVISNTGGNFSAGANVGMIFMMAVEQDFDELNMAVKTFQDTMMRVRYSNIPVVVAPHNMALGGGCELSMHSDKVVAHAELYMGLVEFGVGLIPGGGGSKEFAKRFADDLKDGDVKINRLRERFLTVGQAKVSTSAHEAFDLGYLRKGTDEIVMNREYQLARAKAACLALADAGYIAPKREKNVMVLGQEGLGIIYVGANSMISGHYMSEHDGVISEKLGWVMCGGDLSENTLVTEQYLLDLERKAFVELCVQRKTLERLESLVKTGKILRN
jgi:3-hydroxyacyl-CoA dehydrogenase